MTDTTELIRRLRDASQGHDEWRVQNPEDGCYCIAFSRSGSLDPECEARSWLADHIRQFPQGMFVGYEVKCVRVLTDADRLRLEAADALEQQAAEIAALRADAERLRVTLRFYARGEHYHFGDDEFDTVSGEPENWLFSGRDDSEAMIEDGGYARLALRGVDAAWVNDDGVDEAPQPIDGEVSCAALRQDQQAAPDHLPDAGNMVQAGEGEK